MLQKTKFLAVGISIFSSFWSPSCFAGEVSVLMYHKLDQGGNPALNVTSSQLGKQLDFLARNKEAYSVLTGEESLDVVSGKKRINGLGVLITVDDGWKSAEDFANELSKRKMKGILFMVSGQGDAGCCLGYRKWDAVDEALDVQNHTKSHSAIIDKQSGTPFKADVEKANETIEKWTHERPVFFAWPYGLETNSGREILKDMGFKALFSTKAGIWRSSSQNYDVPRYNAASGDTPERFCHALKISENPLVPDEDEMKKECLTFSGTQYAKGKKRR